MSVRPSCVLRMVRNADVKGMTMQRFVPSTRLVTGEGYAPIVTDKTNNSDFECTVLGSPARFYRESIAYDLAVRNAKIAERMGEFPKPKVYPVVTSVPIADACVARYGNMLRVGRCVRLTD